jgi:hypothetical protein
MHSIFRPGHARGKRQTAANHLCHGMPLRNFADTASAGPRGKCLSVWPVKSQMTRDTSLRKKPSNRRINPPRKSRGIHDLLLPLATREMHSATNHRNRASFRITELGLYNWQTQNSDLFHRLNRGSSGPPESYAAPVMVLIFVILVPNIFFAVTSS